MSENTKTKPRICEVLGIPQGVVVKVVDKLRGHESLPFLVNDEGYAVVEGTNMLVCAQTIQHAINYPETIVRMQRFADDELTLFRVIGAKWASRDKTGFYQHDVFFWKCDPISFGVPSVFSSMSMPLARLPATLFPSICPGQRVNIEEVLKHEKE